MTREFHGPLVRNRAGWVRTPRITRLCNLRTQGDVVSQYYAQCIVRAICCKHSSRCGLTAKEELGAAFTPVPSWRGGKSRSESSMNVHSSSSGSEHGSERASSSIVNMQSSVGTYTRCFVFCRLPVAEIFGWKKGS